MLFQKKVEEMYRARLFVRHDDTGRVKYFAPEEFPGLCEEPYFTASRRGDRLAGRFYFYAGYDESRLVVFDHGLGGGHRSYMKEIEMLARAGFRVFAYDHTGCMQSEGEHSYGLSQSLSDLDDVLRALKGDVTIPTDDISVVGHSWGGYATLNITAFHPEVKRIVVLAGFLSVEEMVKQSFPGPLCFYRRRMLEIEREANPAYADRSAIDALGATEARALLIHSRDDKTVSYRRHFCKMQRALAGRASITFLTVDKRGHNPNYTPDAVAYKETLYAGLKQLPAIMTDDEKTAFRESFDWDRMTAQDEEIWGRIYAHLEAPRI